MLDHKKAAALIVGEAPSEHEGGAEYHDEHGDLGMIAHDLMEGVHAQDHAKVVSALEALCAHVQTLDEEQDHAEMEG